RSRMTPLRRSARDSAATGQSSIERSNDSHGRAQAPGLPRSTGRSTRAPRALAAAARGVPALPPAQAEPPRVPELRLLRRPARVRDQGAEGRGTLDLSLAAMMAP